ncbi:hypothetical protein LY76DRAFT_599018 [Colletotrichum caudatum]|nr:hypothetical protein LY76DRAFT_599018 [Colletotrichum caudatum]
MRYRIPSNAEQLPDPTSLQPWRERPLGAGTLATTGDDGTVESTIKVVMALLPNSATTKVAVNLARALSHTEDSTGDGFARQQPCWPWPDIQKSGWACPSPSIPSIFAVTAECPRAI